VGRDAIAEVAQGFTTAFPDMRVTTDDPVFPPEGAVFHWALTGTNTGPGGALQIERTNVFDYSAHGVTRRQRFVVSLGRRVDSVVLQPRPCAAEALPHRLSRGDGADAPVPRGSLDAGPRNQTARQAPCGGRPGRVEPRAGHAEHDPETRRVERSAEQIPRAAAPGRRIRAAPGTSSPLPAVIIRFGLARGG